MRTSLPTALNQPPESRPRDYLLVNLLVVPGLGSLLAGRRIVGVAQVALALTGFGWSAWWFTMFLAVWLRNRQFPWDGGPWLGAGVAGVALFAGAWLWGLLTGLQIRRGRGL